jgi:hypothetical protein
MYLRTKRFDRAAEGIKTHDWAFNEALTWVKEFVTKHGGIDCLYLCSTDSANVMIPLIHSGDEDKEKLYDWIRRLNLAYEIDHYVVITEGWASLSVGRRPSEDPDRMAVVTVTSVNRERVRQEAFLKKKKKKKKTTLEPFATFLESLAASLYPGVQPLGQTVKGELTLLLPDEWTVETFRSKSSIEKQMFRIAVNTFFDQLTSDYFTPDIEHHEKQPT